MKDHVKESKMQTLRECRREREREREREAKSLGRTASDARRTWSIATVTYIATKSRVTKSTNLIGSCFSSSFEPTLSSRNGKHHHVVFESNRRRICS